MQSPSYELMGMPRGGTSSLETLTLSPLAEACSRLDLTAIHEILESIGYRDDEGTANEVCAQFYIISPLQFRNLDSLEILCEWCPCVGWLFLWYFLLVKLRVRLAQ